jgi:hypothetical protein
MAPELDKLTDALKTALSAAGAYKLALAVVCGAYYYAAKTASFPAPSLGNSGRRFSERFSLECSG